MKSRVIRQKTHHLYAIAAVLFVGVMATYAFVFNNVIGNNAQSSSAAPQETVPTPTTEPVDSNTAREIAQAKKPGATVKNVQTVPVNGVVNSYTVQFTDGSTVEVAAKNGEVTTESQPTASEAPTGMTAPTEPTTEEPTTEPEPTTETQPPVVEEEIPDNL